MWWDIYDDKSLNFKPTTISAPMDAAAEVDESIAEFLAALSNSGIVKIISTPPAA